MKQFLYFSATWCVPCKTFGPIMDRIAMSGIPVQKIDVDTQKDLVSQYHVSGIPTTILVQNGQILNRFTGAKSEQEIRQIYGS
jgi:putative thioredoxin